MDVFSFLSICVVASVFGGMWKAWLKSRREQSSGGLGKLRLAELEERIEQLEGRAATPDDLGERVAVLEAIVVHRDDELAREFRELEETESSR